MDVRRRREAPHLRLLLLQDLIHLRGDEPHRLPGRRHIQMLVRRRSTELRRPRTRCPRPPGRRKRVRHVRELFNGVLTRLYKGELVSPLNPGLPLGEVAHEAGGLRQINAGDPPRFEGGAIRDDDKVWA